MNRDRNSGSNATSARAQNKKQNKEKHLVTHGLLYDQDIDKKSEDSKNSENQNVIYEY